MATLLFGIYTSLIMTLTPPTPDASRQDGDLLGTAVAEERAVQMPPSVQDFQDLQELTAEAEMLVEKLLLLALLNKFVKMREVILVSF